MYKDKFVFAQLHSFLDYQKFRRIVDKYQGNRYVKTFTCWNQLLVLMFGQLCNWSSYLYPDKELSHKFSNFMAMKRRKTYDRAFKENAVNLSHSRSDLSTLARELGLSSDSLYRWRKESEEKGSERFPGKGNSFVSVEAKSDEALLKKIKRLEQENEILKKAVGIISRSDL